MKYLHKAIVLFFLYTVSNALKKTPSDKLIGDATKGYTLENFSTNFFWSRPAQGLYDVNVGLGTNHDKDFKGERIAAMGDLNDDKWLDLVTVSESGD